MKTITLKAWQVRAALVAFISEIHNDRNGCRDFVFMRRLEIGGLVKCSLPFTKRSLTPITISYETTPQPPEPDRRFYDLSSEAIDR